jgi:PEGA domain
MRKLLWKAGRPVMAAMVMVAVMMGPLERGVEGVARADGKRIALSKKSFERAELFYRKAKFDLALVAYNQAMSHFRHPAYLFNIAQCHRQLRRFAKAGFFYRLFLSEAADTPNRVEVERFIEAMALKVAEQRRQERRKGRLSVVTEPPGADVFINDAKGKPLGKTPAVLRLAPGQQVVVLRYPGFQTVQRAVTITRGAVVTVKEILRRSAPRIGGLVAGAGDSGGEARGTPGKPYHRRWWFWTGISVAVAAVGVATYTGTQAVLIRNTWDANRGAPADDPNLLQRGETFRTVTDVLIGVAAVSAGAAIIGAILVARRNRRDRRRAMVVPSCGPSGCGVWVSGRF